MRSLKGKVLSGILCGALVLGLVPGFGMKVNAAEQVTILEEGFEETEISKSETKTGWSTTVKEVNTDGQGLLCWKIRGAKEVEPTPGNLGSVDESGEKGSGANGSKKYAYHNWYSTSDRLTNELISPVINLGNMSSCSLTFYFKNRFDQSQTDDIGKDYLGVFYRVGNAGEWNSITKITDEHKEWTKVTYSLPAGALKNDVQIGFQADVQYGYGVSVDEVLITGVKKEAAPEKAADVTPTKDNSKTYKNEWVNGQWYDANGKTSYKYKGDWKHNSIGWWYEDASGWYPSNMWQKIDGKWYFFHKDGYMAESEYAGGWSQYSEGHWWVGADGAWDGSEPGVWRLVGTKWWFRDSTGWYAHGKWYKIGGKWYEFDEDGWWIE